MYFLIFYNDKDTGQPKSRGPFYAHRDVEHAQRELQVAGHRDIQVHRRWDC